MKHTDYCQRGVGLGDWMKKGAGINQQKHIYVTHRYRQQGSDSQRERGVGEGGDG